MSLNLELSSTDDNSSAISISLRQDPVNTSRTKHMDLRIKWLMEQVNSGLIAPLYVPSAINAADISISRHLRPTCQDNPISEMQPRSIRPGLRGSVS